MFSILFHRASSLMANLPQGQPAVTRPGLGVPVLPPITSTPNPAPPSRGHSSPSLPPTSSAHPPFPTPYSPPPYPQSTPASDRSGSPPPPYYPSQDTGSARRFSQPVPLPTHQHTPSHYTLPDPQVHGLLCMYVYTYVTIKANGGTQGRQLICKTVLTGFKPTISAL